MDSFIGTYKGVSRNFKLKIEVSPERSDKFVFKEIDTHDNENILFTSTLQEGTSGSLTLWGNGIEISHDTVFNTISIIKAPVIGLTDIYHRID
jgi:hypothetical protein